MSGIKTPVTVNGWGVFSGDVRVASCSSAEAAQEVADAINAVARLPRTADGVSIVPGMEVWLFHPDGHEIIQATVKDVHGRYIYVTYDCMDEIEPSWCHSTRESAEKAKEAQR